MAQGPPPVEQPELTSLGRRAGDGSGERSSGPNERHEETTMSLSEPTLATEVLRPGDDGYDDAAAVFFASGSPALVVRPRGSDEVAAALSYAARHGLPVAVRSGGHSALGHGTNDGGLVIDLQRMDTVEVLDRDERLVRVGGGATWGRVAQALAPYGWALTSGDTNDVGVGGLTLGGGMGWMVRLHGLAIDNLVGARVVLADGRQVQASATEHADLFWALRGGGGNFGVVVDLDFRAQAAATVHFGTVTYRLDDAADLVRRWRDAMRGAPDQLSSTLALMPRVPDVPPTATVLLCYAGDDTPSVDVDAAVEPLFELGTVARAGITQRPYAEILEDAQQLPPGLRLAARNVLVPDLGDDVVEAVAGLHATMPPKAVALRSLGGAFGRVPADATAFAHRDAEAMVLCGAVLPEAATDADVERAFEPWQAVAAHGTGTYLNFQGSATRADLAAAYPPATYARLVEVKRSYDPTNVFAGNQNIEP
jgi:FAD/FMN-containing dehydrogenase